VTIPYNKPRRLGGILTPDNADAMTGWSAHGHHLSRLFLVGETSGRRTAAGQASTSPPIFPSLSAGPTPQVPLEPMETHGRSSGTRATSDDEVIQ